MSRKVKVSLVLSIITMITVITTTILNMGITINNPTPNKTATILNEVKAYEKSYGLIFSGETANGSVTIYAKSLPEIDFVIGLKGV